MLSLFLKFLCCHADGFALKGDIGRFYWWSYLFGILKASCSLMAMCFSRLGKFSAINLLNMFPVHLAYACSSFNPMIHRFGILIVFT
jgi:hypothetical protein